MPDSLTLRILSLNLWGGQVLDPLLAFIRAQAPGVDIFCFQEMLDASVRIPLGCRFRTTLFAELSAELPEFDGRFDPMVTWEETAEDGRRVGIPFGLATFARRSLPIARREAVTVIEHLDDLDASPGQHWITRPVQLTHLRGPRGPLLVANYHGMARPGTKLDSPDRIAQSLALRRILAEQAGPDGAVALLGDLNLLPETESVRLLEQAYRNLVVERGVPTTRSRLNPHFGTPTEQRHADYAFVSPALTVVDFEVPDVEISDHLPLILTVTQSRA